MTADKKQWPPRMVLKQNKDGIITAVSLSFVFQSFPETAQEYISLAESEASKSKAVAESRAKAFGEAMTIALSEYSSARAECRDLAMDDDSSLAAQALASADTAKLIAERIGEAARQAPEGT